MSSNLRDTLTAMVKLMYPDLNSWMTVIVEMTSAIRSKDYNTHNVIPHRSVQNTVYLHCESMILIVYIRFVWKKYSFSNQVTNSEGQNRKFTMLE